MGTLAGAAVTTKGVGEEAVREQNPFSSAAAFVEGGVQDADEDSCSICLEPFCHSDPATVTSCRHEYHLQCILEWVQRSKECPMCWQRLSLEDPSSQELLDAVGHEQTWRNSEEVPALPNNTELENQIMQHLVHQMARRAFLQNRQMSLPDNQGQPVGGTGLLPPVEFFQSEATTASLSHSDSPMQSLGAQRNQQESLQQVPFSNVTVASDSFKLRLLSASSKCKETISRTTRSFKERWRGRNTKTTDGRVGGSGGSVEVVLRQALERISFEAAGKEDIPTTSNSAMSQSGISQSSRRKPGAAGS